MKPFKYALSLLLGAGLSGFVILQTEKFAEVAADINAADMVEDTVQKLADNIVETTEE